MEIDISSIKGQPGAGIELEYDEECPELLDEVKCLGPMHVSVRVENTRESMRVSGTLAASVELVCTRCLEPFTYQVESHFDEDFYPTGGEQHSMWLEQQKEPGSHPLGLDDNFYSGNLLDVSQVVRDSFLMAIPLKPICESGCLGICPVCGVNRNKQKCQCKVDDTDPRLEILKGLIEQQ